MERVAGDSRKRAFKLCGFYNTKPFTYTLYSDMNKNGTMGSYT